MKSPKENEYEKKSLFPAAPECQFFNREEEKINIKLEYETLFSNQLVIIVSIQNYNNIRMKLLEVILHNGSVSPLALIYLFIVRNL